MVFRSKILLVLISFSFGLCVSSQYQTYMGALPPTTNSSTCPQTAARKPLKHRELDLDLESLYADEYFKLSAYEALGGIVRIPTESYDDLKPVGQDSRWDVFSELHAQLEKSFPLVYEKLEIHKVNTYGLVFHWKGTNDTLRPVLMTAHQDVVPVEPTTVNQWTYPPYSGHYDGTWIWGRGSCDDKSEIISHLTVVTSLLKNGFQPKRTFVFAYGIDEEATGRQGAQKIAKYLEDRYGMHSFATLLDEGSGFGTTLGGDVLFATPSTAEKGYLDVRIEVSTTGGHSSVPPSHTGIGLLAHVIVAIEENPHPTTLSRLGTSFQMFLCVAEYGPSIPDSIRDLAKRAVNDDDALKEFSKALLALNAANAAIMSTTQAVDLVSGGVKVNALPERVSAVVNHRISEVSSVRDVQKRLTEVVLPVAKKFNLTLDAFGSGVVTGKGAGHITLADAFDSALEPSPVTPIDMNGPYELLAGTIKGSLAASPKYNASSVIVSPMLEIGNTDTQYYWNLTEHIFRYGHIGQDDIYNGIHTVNEALRAEGLIEKIRFHTKFILNWDEFNL